MIDFEVVFDTSCNCFKIEAKSTAGNQVLENHRGFKTKLIMLPESEFQSFKEDNNNLTFNIKDEAL